MDLETVLTSRHSVRSYTGEAISDGQLNKIVNAAEFAPVAIGKYSDYHLTIVQQPALLKAIEAATDSVFHRHGSQMLYGAPTLVIVSTAGNGNANFSSAAIIAHNMALAAVDQGVGYCYIWGAIAGLNQSRATVASLDLPAGFTPACAVVLGQTEETYAPREIDTGRIGVTKL